MLERRKIALLEKQNAMLQSKIDALETELAKYVELENAMLDAKAKYLECIKDSQSATKQARETTDELNGLLKSLKDCYRR